MKAADINVAQKEGFASRRVMQELKDGIASVLLVQTGLDALRLCLERRSKGIYEIGIHDVTQHRREEHKHTEHRTQNSPLQHEDTRTQRTPLPAFMLAAASPLEETAFPARRKWNNRER